MALATNINKFIENKIIKGYKVKARIHKSATDQE